MSNKVYKVVPFMGQIKSGASAKEVSAQLENIINSHASQGWDFCSVDSVNITIRPGCLAGLLGGKTSYVRYDQVIFKRDA